MIKLDRNWDPFCTKEVQADLKGKSVRGGLWSLVGQGGRTGLELVRVIVLARLLTPADFGLIGMVMVLAGFLELFKDAGLSLATVQREKITHEQISSLFWVNVGIGVLLAILMVAFAPLVVMWYKQPSLLNVTMVLALSFPISSFIIQHQALLTRQMCFHTLTVINLLTTAFALIVAIVAAAFGLRHWALVASMIAGPAFNAMLVWWLVPWRPGKFERGHGILPMLKFGGHLTGNAFLFRLVDLYPNLLVGRWFGDDALGYLTRAKQLVTRPLYQAMEPLHSVSVPALSRLNGQDDEAYCKYVSYQWALLRCVVTPIFCVCVVMYDWLIDIVLGPQWGPVKPLFLLLSLGLMLGVGIWITAGVLTSQGRTREYLETNIVRLPLRLTGITVGAMYSLEWMVGIDAFVANVMVIVLIWVCGRRGPITRRYLVKGYFVYTLMLITPIGLGWATRWGLSMADVSELVKIMVTGFACAAFSAVSIFILPQNRKVLRTVWESVRTKLSGNPTG